MLHVQDSKASTALSFQSPLSSCQTSSCLSCSVLPSRSQTGTRISQTMSATSGRAIAPRGTVSVQSFAAESTGEWVSATDLNGRHARRSADKLSSPAHREQESGHDVDKARVSSCYTPAGMPVQRRMAGGDPVWEPERARRRGSSSAETPGGLEERGVGYRRGYA